MTKPRRNDRCSCGSGLKYKKCCGSRASSHPVVRHVQDRSEKSSDTAEVRDSLEGAFRAGDFNTAIRLAKALRASSPKNKRFATVIGYLSCVYADTNVTTESIVRKLGLDVLENEIMPFAFNRLGGGQGMFEVMLVRHNDNESLSTKDADLRTLAGTIDQYFDDNERGTTVFEHPSAVLALAEKFVGDKATRPTARLLVCMALGCCRPVTVGTDLRRLSALLAELCAPMELWTDWCDLLTTRRKFLCLLERDGDWISSETATWVENERLQTGSIYDDAERRSHGQVSVILKALSSHLDVTLDEIEPVVSGIDKSAMDASEVKAWTEVRYVKARYSWFGCFTDFPAAEFVVNGDWALFCCPTEDYSMGLAQWWRFLEWRFKRILVKQIGELFDDHPEWRAEDEASLSRTKKKEESLFVEKLADPEKRKRLSLWECMVLFRQCVIDPPDHSASRMRQEAVREMKSVERFFCYFNPRNPILANLSPDHFTKENIDLFRNGASHTEPITRLEACIGRRIAIRLLDYLHLPELAEWNMEPLHNISFESDWPIAEFKFASQLLLEQKST